MAQQERVIPEMQQPGMGPEELPEPLPFEGIEKSQTLQETRHFSEPSINERKCGDTIIKLLYLFAQGEQFTEAEATDTFFAASKLFQSENQDLRRQVYIVLKELSHTAQNVFMVTSTLCKDINDNVAYKANAIRLLGKITEMDSLGPIDRCLEQALVDKNPSVATAALVTCNTLGGGGGAVDLVKKWQNEINEGVRNRNHPIVQYHALGLLHKLKKSNKTTLLKMVQQMNSLFFQSTHPHCLLIRMSTDILKEDYNGNPQLADFVIGALKNGSAVVVFEAAKSMCALSSKIPVQEIGNLALVLQLYLSFHRPVWKFATLRLFNKIAFTQPLAVSPGIKDMESMLSNPNKNIATLAITTLLLAGNENHLDSLLGDINKFLSGIADEFKSVVISAMKNVGRKFPDKHHLLIQSLAENLKEEGGCEYKMSVVDSIASLVETNSASKENGLIHLCEYIEDCDYPKICIKILSLLGREGPTTQNPNKLVRFIYNRVLLEQPSVRAAAVSTLAKFAAKCPPLRDSILNLLKSAVNDNEDEVRDRAVFYVALLESNDDDLINTFITEIESEVKTAVPAPTASSEAPPMETTDTLQALMPEEEEEGSWVKELMTVPQFQKLGKPFKSSEPLAITDREFDYTITCVKHCFLRNFILHFKIVNNLDDATLTKVQIQASLEHDEDLASMTPRLIIPASEIPPDSEGNTYLLIDRDPNDGWLTGSCPLVISFTVEDEPSTYEAEQELIFNLADYHTKTYLPNFESAWAAAGDEITTNSYQLDSIKRLQEATDRIIDFYGFHVYDGCDKVVPNSTSHELRLSGSICFDPPFEVMIKAAIFLTQTGGVSLTLEVKGAYDDLRQTLCDLLVD